jgi:hypothetical protein
MRQAELASPHLRLNTGCRRSSLCSLLALQDVIPQISCVAAPHVAGGWRCQTPCFTRRALVCRPCRCLVSRVPVLPHRGPFSANHAVHAPMSLQQSKASSTAVLQSRPSGSTRHRFMMVRYSPMTPADLHRTMPCSRIFPRRLATHPRANCSGRDMLDRVTTGHTSGASGPGALDHAGAHRWAAKARASAADSGGGVRTASEGGSSALCARSAPAARASWALHRGQQPCSGAAGDRLNLQRRSCKGVCCHGVTASARLAVSNQ